jgi:hypothetical protein
MEIPGKESEEAARWGVSSTYKEEA